MRITETKNPEGLIMKTLRYIMVLAVASMLMASCGYPDHLKTLPKETVAVVSFDLAGMAAKGDLDKLQEAEFYKKMQEKMSKTDSVSAKETDEFLKNPLNYGINFIEPVYLFVINNGADVKPSVGVSIALGDADKFKTLVSKILKSGDEEVNIETATGYSFVTTPEVHIAWSEAALIVLPVVDKETNYTDNLNKIFADKGSDGSVTDVAGFKSFYKKSKDISGWLSMDVLGTIMDAAKKMSPETADNEYLKNYNAQLEKLKGASFQFHVTFKDDEIYTEYVTDLPDDLQKMYSEEVLRSGVPDKMANLVKSTDLGVVSLSINIQNYLKMMSDSPALDEKTQQEMKQYVAMAQQFIAPFDGDIIFTLSDIKETERTVTESVPVETVDDDNLTASTDEDSYDWDDWDMEYRDTTYTKKETLPIFLAATTINDETFGFLGMMLGKDKPKAGKVTETELGAGLTIYTTIIDKMLVVGNDKAAVEAIQAGTYKGDKNSTMAKGVSSHGTYVYANLNMEEYPKAVQDKITVTANDKKSEAVLKLLGMFDTFEAYNKANYTAVLSLKLKPNGHNSLYTILEYTGNAAYDMGALN